MLIFLILVQACGSKLTQVMPNGPKSIMILLMAGHVSVRSGLASAPLIRRRSSEMSTVSQSCLEGILNASPVGVLSTYSENGIHAVPIVFALVDGVLWSPVDGKPKSSAHLKRLDNLSQNNRFTLLLDHYADDWNELWWISLEGSAEIVNLDERHTELSNRLKAALLQKYPQYKVVPLFSANNTLIKLTGHETRAWAFRGLNWLEQRFS